MLTAFTPPPVPRRKPPVKREPVEQEPTVKREPMGPDTPWAMQTVIVQPAPAQAARLVRVEPVHPPKRQNPWETPRPPAMHGQPSSARSPDLPPPPATQPHGPPSWREPSTAPPAQGKKARTKPSENPPADDRPRKHVTARNYAAIEAGLERFGLIDEGQRFGARALLVHVRKRFRPPFLLLNAVRPGMTLVVKRLDQTAALRVRSITPARYYSPGSQVTTLSILVDDTDWRSLTASPSRI